MLGQVPQEVSIAKLGDDKHDWQWSIFEKRRAGVKRLTASDANVFLPSALKKPQ